MALPEPFYHDPALLIERTQRPSLAQTCFRCSSNQIQDGEYKCVLGMTGYPKLNRDTCTWWGRKR